MGSSSRRQSRRHTKPKNKQQSSSGSKKGSTKSRTGSANSYTAPTYSVSEDSDGALLNRRLNLAWPAYSSAHQQRADGKNKYQRALGSEYAASSSPSSEAQDRQFASSPYEMISIADLDYAAAAKRIVEAASRRSSDSDSSSKSRRTGSKKSSRAGRGREARRSRCGKGRGRRDDEDEDSPQYVQLSSDRSPPQYKQVADSQYEQLTPPPPVSDRLSIFSDENSMKVDSIVFNTQAELEHYQNVLGAQRVALEERKRAERLAEWEERRIRSIQQNAAALAAAAAAASERRSTATTTSRASTPTSRYVPERDDVARHYIGVKSQRAVNKRLKSGEFFMYYDKPAGEDIPVMIELKIGYMNSNGNIHHYPIQRFESRGERYYAVMQTEMDVKMFPSIASLVQHYHTFSHVNPKTGRLETFGAC